MSKAIELLKKIISKCSEVEKDHPFPNEPLTHNRPCHRCDPFSCYVIEAIEALTELQAEPAELKCNRGKEIRTRNGERKNVKKENIEKQKVRVTENQ